MRKSLLLLFTLLWAVTAFSQTQRGYVKTKGRMVNGQLVPGQGLKGTTVSIKGRTAVLVNNDDGSFSFPVTETQFKLDSVKKKGYELVDSEALTRSYKPSPNPIYLVMETPDQQLQDQLAAERKIRRTLTNQLQQQEDEIEALREQQKLTDEEYRRVLQKLYETTDQNEQLVKDMVERYSQIDYDQLSEFDQIISELILNGDLIKADSMLRTKGDINERISQLRQHEAINTREQEALAQRQEQLEQSRLLARQELEDIANDCYRKYEIFKLQHQNDSAAYYIELKASLDTTDIQCQLEAGDYIFLYIEDFDRALALFNQALTSSKALFGAEDNTTGSIYQAIGEVYLETGDFDKALEYYEEARRIFNLHADNETTEEFRRLFNLLGIYYYNIGDMDQAIEYTYREIRISKELYGEDCRDLSSSYDNLSVIYDDAGMVDSAIYYAERSRDLEIAAFGPDAPGLASILLDLGLAYKHAAYQTDDDELIEKAFESYMEALRIALLNYGEENSRTSNIYHSISSIYDYIEDYEQAIAYDLKDLEISKAIFGERHPSTGLSYSGLGLSYYYLGDYEAAKENYYKALGILKYYYDNGLTNKTSLYVNLGSLHLKQQEYDSAVYYYSAFINTHERIYGKHRDIAFVYYKLSQVYMAMDNDSEAIDCLEKAIAMEKDLGGTNIRYLATYYTNLGVLYHRHEQYGKALPCFQEALSLSIELYGEEDEDVAWSYLNLANTMFFKGDLDQALPNYESALRIFSALDKPQDVSNCHHRLGNLYYQQGNYLEALKHYEEAYRLRLQVWGESHNRTIESKEKVDELKAKLAKEE